MRKTIKSKLGLGFIILSLLSSNLINSQNEIRLGLNNGLNFTTFNESIFIESSSPKPGFLIGSYFEYYLNDVLSIKTNLNYVRKSHKSEFILNNEYGEQLGVFEQTVKNNDLMLPILLKYDFGKSKNLFINGGFALSYLFNVKTEFDEPDDEIQKIALNDFDVYLTVGAGSKFTLDEKNDLSIELRYNYNIPNIDVIANYANIVETNTVNFIVNWNFRL